MSKLTNLSVRTVFFSILMFPIWAMAVSPYQDNNRAPVRAADDFEYSDTTSGPYQHGWVKISGRGSAICSTIVGVGADALEKRFATFYDSIPHDLSYIVQYPPDTSEIKNKRPNFGFNFRATDSFAIEAKVQVRWATDSTKYYWLRYRPGSGTNFQQTDTLVFFLGTGLLDGKWHYLARDFGADVHSFLSSKSFYFLSRIFVKGGVSVNSFMTFNRHLWIEGYTNQSSVAQGGTINFYLSRGDVDTIGSSSTANIEIRRYGATTDLIATISGVTVFRRDTIANPDSGLSQNWPLTASWTVPQSAKSGVYMARFVITSAGPGFDKYTYCPFVVKEDSGGTKSKILFKVSDNTWQAYNHWGGNTLNYLGATPFPRKVSYNRPYSEVYYYCGHRTYLVQDSLNICSCGLDNGGKPDTCTLEDELNPVKPYDSLGAGQFFVWEFPQVQWLESHGYAVEYCDDIDLENWRQYYETSPDPNKKDTLEFYNLLISSGHDEYWTRLARVDIQQRFRHFSDPKQPSYPQPPLTATHNISFLSGNTIFARVDYSSSKRQISMDAGINSSFDWHCEYDSSTCNSDSLNRGRITGLRWWNYNVTGTAVALQGRADTTWIMKGTGISQGGSFGSGHFQSGGYPFGISGYEVDYSTCNGTVYFPDSLNSCANGLTILAKSSSTSGEVAYYDWPTASTSPKPKRSRIFNAGGVQWSWGLKDSDSLTNKITKNITDGLGATVRSNIMQNTTWRGNIYLGGDVTIDSGVTLTINPGTKIYFFPNNDVERTGGNSNKTELIVKGTLTCLGTQADSIILTSASTAPSNGNWGGVRFTYPGRGEFEFTRFSYADTALAVWGDTATVIVYNSTFTHFDKAAVYSKSAKTKLGGIFPIPIPPDCGRNNFLMNTATSGAKAVIKSTTPSGTLKAEGNWWTQAPPLSSWFVGNVDRTPYLLGYATPDSCGGNPGQSPPPPGGRISVKPTMPVSFELGQNYPNPFNPATTIQYALPEPAKVELKIYNILGQVVRTLVDEYKELGYHQAVWNGKDEAGRPVSTGVYLYRIRAGDFVETKKMQLVK